MALAACAESVRTDPTETVTIEVVCDDVASPTWCQAYSPAIGLDRAFYFDIRAHLEQHAGEGSLVVDEVTNRAVETGVCERDADCASNFGLCVAPGATGFCIESRHLDMDAELKPNRREFDHIGNFNFAVEIAGVDAGW